MPVKTAPRLSESVIWVMGPPCQRTNPRLEGTPGPLRAGRCLRHVVARNVANGNDEASQRGSLQLVKRPRLAELDVVPTDHGIGHRGPHRLLIAYRSPPLDGAAQRMESRQRVRAAAVADPYRSPRSRAARASISAATPRSCASIVVAIPVQVSTSGAAVRPK